MITIRPIDGYAEYIECEQIQREVWGEFGAVPMHQLITAQRNGGLVLGAFDTEAPDTPMLGFVYGFLGRTREGRLKHCSHMAAVRSPYRNAQLGERLKLVQRELVLAQGLDLITWTFDPLISRNAHLNLHKLGAVCRTYIRNIYGPEPEPEDDLPSDRFQVDWWISSPQVQTRLAAEPPASSPSGLRATATLLNPDPGGADAAIAGKQVLLQIPADVEALKAADMAYARAWRYQLRRLAESAFAAGYQVIDYVRDGDVGLYLLTQEE